MVDNLSPRRTPPPTLYLNLIPHTRSLNLTEDLSTNALPVLQPTGDWTQFSGLLLLHFNLYIDLR